MKNEKNKKIETEKDGDKEKEVGGGGERKRYSLVYKCKGHLYLSVIAFILAGVANYEGSPHSFDRKISRKQTLYTLYTACFVHTRFSRQ